MTLLDHRWQNAVPLPNLLLGGPQADDPITNEEEFLAAEVERLTEALNSLAERHAGLIATARGASLLGDMGLVVQALAGLGFAPPDGADPFDLMNNPPVADVLKQVDR